MLAKLVRDRSVQAATLAGRPNDPEAGDFVHGSRRNSHRVDRRPRLPTRPDPKAGNFGLGRRRIPSRLANSVWPFAPSPRFPLDTSTTRVLVVSATGSGAATACATPGRPEGSTTRCQVFPSLPSPRFRHEPTMATLRQNGGGARRSAKLLRVKRMVRNVPHLSAKLFDDALEAFVEGQGPSHHTTSHCIALHSIALH